MFENLFLEAFKKTSINYYIYTMFKANLSTLKSEFTSLKLFTKPIIIPIIYRLYLRILLLLKLVKDF